MADSFFTLSFPSHTLLISGNQIPQIQKQGSAARNNKGGAIGLSMDRNTRYSRRGGYPVSASHRHGDMMAKPTIQDANCLCDGQPISLAMAYVKPQVFGEVYAACDGWKSGTLFPDLNMPYCIGGKRR